MGVGKLHVMLEITWSEIGDHDFDTPWHIPTLGCLKRLNWSVPPQSCGPTTRAPQAGVIMQLLNNTANNTATVDLAREDARVT